MKTNSRSVVSAAAGVGLAAATIISAVATGIAAPATVISFGLLAIYGLLEIAVVSYAPRRAARSSALPRIADVVEFPTQNTQAQAA